MATGSCRPPPEVFVRIPDMPIQHQNLPVFCLGAQIQGLKVVLNYAGRQAMDTKAFRALLCSLSQHSIALSSQTLADNLLHGKMVDGNGNIFW